MPQKTRKEKILASQRKKYRIIETPVSSPELKSAVVSKSASKKTISSSHLSEEENQIKKYFITDLKKSLFIIALVFALEFFFYFATMSNNLSKYLNF